MKKKIAEQLFIDRRGISETAGAVYLGQRHQKSRLLR